ncbi:MAG: DUF6702 family protein [Lewinella sp.]
MLLLSILLALLPAHDYHVSKTNVRYVEDKHQVQVEMHLFVEDLEKDMMASGAPEALEIGTKRQHEDAERYLFKYLEQHFTVNWNGADLSFEVVGYELADDLHGLWIYMLTDATDGPSEVIINSTLLTGTYDDQKNIVKLYDGAERSATLLMSKDQPSARY